MIDLKLVREKPEVLNASLKQRGLCEIALELQASDELIRAKNQELYELQAKRNSVAKQVGILKSQKADPSSYHTLLQEAETYKEKLPAIENQIKTLEEEFKNKLIQIPNILDESVPFGLTEDDNVVIETKGQIKKFSFDPKEHFVLGEDLGMMDFEQTAKISGTRFVTLKGQLAKLERALRNFMIDSHIQEFGYQEINPPFLVRANAAFGAGQLPKFEEDLFKTTNDYYLISTSEVPLCNLVADQIIKEEMLPLRFVAYSHCFRSEAGSAGKDTRGMIRQHQFSKVELVSITTPNDSAKEHERMTKAACNILEKLELPYRKVLLCSADTGFASSKTYDLEVWLPGQNRYREISSCSNCLDFQARRLKARYKTLNEQKNIFVHTLNGSGLAIGRTIVAIMENYQNEDGSITIPKALLPYFNDIQRISKKA